MRFTALVGICLALLAQYAEAKAVFAHFMVGNTAQYDQGLWQTEMDLAKASRIDAFVLNIAQGEAMNTAQIEHAFNAAANRGFKLLFSFDYAGRGPWLASDVLALLRKYGGTAAYWKHKGLPLVSTFEGPGSSGDWVGIKRDFPCFFVPDWSSLGAEPAVALGRGIIDGLFNWAAWPNHPDWPKDTYIDASYLKALGNLPYMMPVSPWFYTNLPKYDKNWLWRGEMLWFDRWQQTLHVQPEWVQIISWNDYGESHYIGPIRGDASLIALSDGKAPFNYVKGIEHGNWRAFLPYVISLYKTGTASMTQEGVMVWHRMQSKAAGCNDGGTTAYTATHMQPEGPWDIGMRDGIWFAAQLGSAGTAEVTVGGTVFKPEWRRSPHGGVGIYVGFVVTSNTGTVKVDIKRGGAVAASVTSTRAIAGCQEGYYNFNPAVTTGWGANIAAKSPPININSGYCMQGTGVGDFGEMCQNTCAKYDYCPLSACMCTKFGAQQGTDIVRGPPGYPAAGRDTNWSGLCAVACSYGYCPSKFCGMTKLPDIISTVSPFTPKSCTSGKANTGLAVDQSALAKICEFGCRHGYCPSHSCVCTSTGTLNLATGYKGIQPDFGHENLHVRLLCRFTCGYGVCPWPLCKKPPGPNGETIYIGPAVHTSHTAKCETPPCVFVMPPVTLRTPTTISARPYKTTLEVGASQGGTFVATTTVITVTVRPITITVVSVSNYNVPSGQAPGGTFRMTPSVTFAPSLVTLTKPNGVVTTRSLTLPPWPQISSFTAGGSSGGGITGGPVATITYPARTSRPRTTVLPCSRSTHVVPEYDATITLRSCNGAGATMTWGCPATATVGIDEPTSVDFSLGCTRWTGTRQTIPTMTQFPPGSEIEFIEQDGDNDGDDSTTSCRLWFFSICVSWGVRIGGWRWNFPGPVVIIGPPPIKWPEHVTLKGNLPGPWPPITIGPDGKVTIPPVAPGNCETQSAELCSTSTSISTTVSGGTTRTVTTRVTSTCDTIRGCILPDGNYDTTSTGGGACPINLSPRTAAAEDVFMTTMDAAPSSATALDAPESSASADSASDTEAKEKRKLTRRAPGQGRDHAMIFPRYPGAASVDVIKNWLRNTNSGMPGRPNYGDFKEVKANGAGDNGRDWIPLIFVPNMRRCHIDFLDDEMEGQVESAYGIYERNGGPVDSDDEGSDFDSAVADSAEKKRRAVVPVEDVFHWELPQISVGPGEPWRGIWDTQLQDEHYMQYNAEESFGKGQTIFVLEDDYWGGNEEFDATHYLNGDSGFPLDRPTIETLPESDWGLAELNGPAGTQHGTEVLSKVTGWKLGLAKRAKIIVVKDRTGIPADRFNLLNERYLERWVRVYNKVKTIYAGDSSQRGKIIVTTSSGGQYGESGLPEPMTQKLFQILKKLDELDVVIVAAAHNFYDSLGDDMLNALPTHFGDPASPNRLDNLIVVGGTDPLGRISRISPYAADWLVMAPGWGIFTADGENSIGSSNAGNSFAAPLVAGLVAYWRGLPGIANGWGDELKKPANVKKLLLYMQRPILRSNIQVQGLDESQVLSYPNGYPADRRGQVPFIWTGVHNGQDCLVNPAAHAGCPQGQLSNLVPHGAGCQQPGSAVARDLSERAVGPVCVLRGGSGPSVIGDPVTFSPGSASPTCSPGSPGCGSACTGYYCVPSPTGFPPDRWDPENPAPNEPTLPPLPGPTTCTGNQVTSTSTMCNGPVASPVCATTKICVAPPPPTTTTRPPTTTTTAPNPTDPNSPECKRCGTALGASECPAADKQCLLDECYASSDCQLCNFDCEGIFDTTDPNSPECKQCADDLGASECPADDSACLIGECAFNQNCQLCQFDCEGLFDR